MDEKQEQKFHQLTEEPVGRLISQLAVPCIISMLVTAFYNMADTFFVGMLRSNAATGAVGVVFSMMAVIQAIGFFFGHGSGNFISRELGKHHMEEASNMAATGFFTALFTGLAICILGEIFLTPLATLLLPEVTRAHILGRRRTLETLVGRIMLFTNLFSVLAGGLIALNAAPLARLLYRDESVGLYLLVLAPVLPGMYLDAMGDSILKGLGEEVATFRYSIWDSMLRIALVLLLMPHFGMTGFLVVMWASNVTSALLNIFRIHKVTGIRTRWFEWFIQPALLFAAAAALGQTFVRIAAPAGDVWQVACNVAATGGLFCLFLLPLGAGRQLKAVLETRRTPAKEN